MKPGLLPEFPLSYRRQQGAISWILWFSPPPGRDFVSVPR